jgi:hypothetical protein
MCGQAAVASRAGSTAAPRGRAVRATTTRAAISAAIDVRHTPPTATPIPTIAAAYRPSEHSPASHRRLQNHPRPSRARPGREQDGRHDGRQSAAHHRPPPTGPPSACQDHLQRVPVSPPGHERRRNRRDVKAHVELHPPAGRREVGIEEKQRLSRRPAEPEIWSARTRQATRRGSRSAKPIPTERAGGWCRTPGCRPGRQGRRGRGARGRP